MNVFNALSFRNNKAVKKKYSLVSFATRLKWPLFLDSACWWNLRRDPFNFPSACRTVAPVSYTHLLFCEKPTNTTMTDWLRRITQGRGKANGQNGPENFVSNEMKENNLMTRIDLIYILEFISASVVCTPLCKQNGCSL